MSNERLERIKDDLLVISECLEETPDTTFATGVVAMERIERNAEALVAQCEAFRLQLNESQKLIEQLEYELNQMQEAQR